MKNLLAFAASWAIVSLLAAPAAYGQQAPTAKVVTACGTQSYVVGSSQAVTQTATGLACGSTSTSPSGTQDTNLKQVNGATVNVGTGASGTGTQRVTTSTDSTIGTVTTVTSATVVQPTAASLNATVVGTGTFATQAATSPATRTLVTLDIKTVTTGGTAVNALSAGHRTAGGFLQNPVGATINLCINEIGTSAGTTSSGDTTCIQPGQSYTVAPAAGAVSVVTSDSSHPFSGYGLN